MRFIQSIKEIAENYDAFIIDLWGVMHDGSALYPGARDALAYLHAQNKPVVFLSNAPRKAARAEQTLIALGIERTHFLEVITSGQVAYDKLSVNQSMGTHYYYLGPGKDEEVLEGLGDYTKVTRPEEAHFILNTGFEYDWQPEEEIEPLLKHLTSLDLPLLCVNPDLEVVKQDGTQLLCAGWVARRYEQLGGRTEYIGKPYGLVYQHSLEALSHPPRVLAIGDNLLTDVKGANAMQIDSLLITGGILRSERGEYPTEAALEVLFAETGATPSYVAELFSL